MKRILLGGAFALILCTNASAQNDQLYGTWRLLSAVTTVVATGEKYETYGKAPHGFITYGPDGRMQVIIAADQRLKPSHSAIADMTDKEAKELLLTMAAYAGTYNFDGKTVTHHIDVSWNEVWTGTHQIRDVRLDGERATFITRPAPRNTDGRISTTTLIWEKVK
jgi:hypothetical protein